MELPFRIKFSLSRKLSGYLFPAISKQRDVMVYSSVEDEQLTLFGRIKAKKNNEAETELTEI